MMRQAPEEQVPASFLRAVGERVLRSPSQLIVSLIVTAGLIGILLRLGDPRQIFGLLTSAQPQPLALALGFYTLVYLARTWRFRSFSPLSGIALLRMLSITAVHALSVMVLPVRTGELTLIYLLRRWEAVPVGRGAGILLVSRFYDLLAVALFSLGALGLYQFTLGGSGSGLILGAIGLILALALGVMLSIRPLWTWALRLWRTTLDRFGWAGNRLARAVTSAGLEVEAVLREASGTALAPRLLLASLLVWMGWFGTAWALLGAMGFGRLSFSQVVIGSTGGVLTGVLPINAVGNWGTMQAGWTAGFALFGVSPEDGIATGFAVQIYVLLFTLGFALLSILVSEVIWKRGGGRN